MALTISIEDDPQTNQIDFDVDDPVYWFLYPYFEETYREVGQMVDLYGNAEFFAEQLVAFFQVLEKAERDAQSREDQWPVTIAYRSDDRTPIERVLRKSDALKRIDALKQMLNHAYNIDRRVVCFGD